MPIVSSDVFPALHYCTKLSNVSAFYDIKFYPYPTADEEQIFAVTGGREVYICRIRTDAEPPFEILRWFKNDETLTGFNSLAWTKDPITREPLLCIAGENPKHIKLLDVESGQIVQTLTGHGKAINDLAVLPLSTDLIASCSEDYTIRLWNIHPRYREQPCVAIFSGEGHKQPLLAINFHANGQWLLSGGLDTAVCLWAVPSLEELARPGNDLRNNNEPTTIYYPHFYSTEVHPNYVDCLQFYGDLIVSRSSRDQLTGTNYNEILIWEIEGFNSKDLPSIKPPVPKLDFNTRSAFVHDVRSLGFNRKLTLHMPKTDRFYQRFALVDNPTMRPILCMGNQESSFWFWDLQRLIEQGGATVTESSSKPKAKRTKKGSAAPQNFDSLDRVRGESVASDATSLSSPAAASVSSTERKSGINDNLVPLKPHHTVTCRTTLSKEHHFATSQMDWSPDGTWLVGVGDNGIMCLFHREKGSV